MTKTIKLKPRPFCGGNAVLCGGERIDPVIDEGGAYIDANIESLPYYVECTVCGSLGQAFDNEDESDKENAIKAWNRRSA